MELAEFIERFAQLRQQGFIPSTRQGTTGVGKTLEDALGIAENNLAIPDIGRIELKAHRVKSPSMVTLFTFNRKAWQIPPTEAIAKYGSWDDENKRMGLYYTLSLKPNSAGLFLYLTDKQVTVRHISGEVVVSWELSALKERFQQKIPAMILVSTFTEERNGKEYFHFYRAQLLQGTSTHLLQNQFQEETIVIDLRLHHRDTKGARNHGTGFRCTIANLPRLFTSIIDI